MSIEASIAANRFGLGARPGDIERIARDPKGWLLGQLRPEAKLPGPMAALPSTVEDLGVFNQWLTRLAATARARGMDPAAMGPDARRDAAMAAGVAAATPQAGGSAVFPPGAEPPLSVEAEYRKTFLPRYARALQARFDVSVESERPFFERLVHFWTNHFVVSGAKPGAMALPPSFERDAIRPHVSGRFLDMLIASSKHPAMLYYLDNYQSIGPNSVLARNPGLRPRPRGDFAPPVNIGLNENLAREILELQTLGVRGGYTQADVTNFAKVITGWTIARPPRVRLARLVAEGRLNGKGLFEFDDETHEPGPQTVMGAVYAEAGADQGEAVLQAIARHPSTARFVATKLARHFIADDPPAAAVDRLAAVFLDTGGDLGKLIATLVESPEAWVKPLQKFKTPQEYLVSAARALPGLKMDSGQLQRAFYSLGQAPYNPPGPNGWPDIEAEWLGADAVWKRFQWANEAARLAPPVADPVALANAVLGAALSRPTLQAIERAESAEQGLTLLLASAEFQRR